jgi:hypothetical protein
MQQRPDGELAERLRRLVRVLPDGPLVDGRDVFSEACVN